MLLTTAYGLRRWLECAEAAGLGPDLLKVLAQTRLYVRGPKARGAARANGLTDVGISPDETTPTLAELVAGDGVDGQTVAVQLHGLADDASLARLRAAGAAVLTVTPYRWISAREGDALHRLITATCDGSLDAVTFTSAPAVDAVFSAAGEIGRREDFTRALCERVPAVAVGPVTAGPLLAAGIPPVGARKVPHGRHGQAAGRTARQPPARSLIFHLVPPSLPCSNHITRHLVTP